MPDNVRSQFFAATVNLKEAYSSNNAKFGQLLSWLTDWLRAKSRIS